MPRMLSGHLQGRALARFSQMLQPSRILEIGTFTGYSALCMCEGLRPDGKLFTLDINEELEEMVRGYFERSGYASRIEYILGNAHEVISGLDETFDMVRSEERRVGKEGVSSGRLRGSSNNKKKKK